MNTNNYQIFQQFLENDEEKHGWGHAHFQCIGRNFDGYSICIKHTNLLDKFYAKAGTLAESLIAGKFTGQLDDYREELGSLFNEASISVENNTPRGRKPNPAKEEYFRRFPNGKPQRLSFSAIHRDFQDENYNVSERTLQNYDTQVRERRRK